MCAYPRLAMLVVAALLAGCATGDGGSGDSNIDCNACTDPDQPECSGCLLSAPDPGSATGVGEVSPYQDSKVVDQLTLTLSTLDFAVVGDTRPAVINDTAGYPTAIITKIFKDLEAESPRPGFAVATGDYQFSSSGGAESGPQLDLYIKARSSFKNTEYPAMGNHECTGATKSNCGPGTTNGSTGIYNTYFQKILKPLGLHNPYYSIVVQPTSKAWSAKVVFIAANAWTSAQSKWLDSVLAQPSTYTFIVRHESSSATTAPGVTPSGKIIAKHPYTLLIVGHSHTYKHVSEKEVIVGIGGAPLTTGTTYGYGIVSRRADGTILFAAYDYKTHAVLDSFVVNADGSPASGGVGSACSHDPCATGRKLAHTCDPCVTAICTADGYCCGMKANNPLYPSGTWDAQCVQEVGSICGASCN